MTFIYLTLLLASIGCMALIDFRYRLLFWRNAGRAAVVIALGLAFFLGWDLLGIGLGIFFRGETSFMTGIVLAPELPLEEPIFLIFLCYLTLVVLTGSERLLTQLKRESRRKSRAQP